VQQIISSMVRGVIMATKQIRQFGNQAGGTGWVPMEYPSYLGFEGDGNGVAALWLNQEKHGGTASPTVQVDLSNDYITEFEVHGNGIIKYVRFKPKLGPEIICGATGGTDNAVYRGRILRIGAKTDNVVYWLEIEYVDGYADSTPVDDGTAVLSYITGQQTCVSFTETTVKLAQSYSLTSTFMSSFSLDVSAQAEYFAKFSAATQLKTQDTTIQEIKRSSEQAQTNQQTVTTTIPLGYVAVLEATVQVMKDPSGNTWIYPTGPADWGTYNSQTDGHRFVGHYDFTAGFADVVNLQRQSTNSPLVRRLAATA
jgi:hypothetical protein